MPRDAPVPVLKVSPGQQPVTLAGQRVGIGTGFPQHHPAPQLPRRPRREHPAGPADAVHTRVRDELRTHPDHVRGDLHGQHPQARQHGMRHLTEQGVLTRDVQIDRDGRQRPRHQPQPAQPHVQPGENDVQRGEHRNPEIDTDRHRERQPAKRRLRRLLHTGEGVDEPQQTEDRHQGRDYSDRRELSFVQRSRTCVGDVCRGGHRASSCVHGPPTCARARCMRSSAR